jgi:hypothetical protein
MRALVFILLLLLLVGATAAYDYDDFYYHYDADGEGCPLGTYVVFDGEEMMQVLCVPCPVSYYSDTFNATACTECALGETTANVGATACFPVDDDDALIEAA